MVAVQILRKLGVSPAKNNQKPIPVAKCGLAAVIPSRNKSVCGWPFTLMTPFPVLGFPRIVFPAVQLDAVFKMVDSPANGLCFCSGSLSARPDNDSPALVRQFAPRIHAAHLRSTQPLPDGSVDEADHLAGSVNMPSVVQTLQDEQCRRRANHQGDWRIPFRPDHGHAMMNDLEKPPGITPGYSCIGRVCADWPNCAASCAVYVTLRPLGAQSAP